MIIIQPLYLLIIIVVISYFVSYPLSLTVVKIKILIISTVVSFYHLWEGETACATI